MFRRLTKTEYDEWARYYRNTGFETMPTRAALAQLTHIYLGSKLPEEKKAPSIEDLMYPRKPEESDPEDQNKKTISSLLKFVHH